MMNFTHTVLALFIRISIAVALVFSGAGYAVAQTEPAVGQPVQATIALTSTVATVTITSIQPAVTGPVTVTLLGGVDQNLLMLFGGTATIADGANLPATLTFPISPALSQRHYYARLYVDAASANLIYPPVAQPPLTLTFTSSAVTQEVTNQNTEQSGVETEASQTTPAGPSGFTAPSGGLVPCGNPGQAQCTFNDVIAVISNLINYIFVGIVPIATVMFVIIGTQYMLSGGNIELKSLMKERLGNLILGIVIVLGAWLLIATILRVLGVNDAYILLDL